MTRADARRRAEEALANFERFVFIGGPAHPDKPYHDAGVNLATALRALLAAGPEAKTCVPETAPKRRAIPPFEVRRDIHGFADGIQRGGWTLLRLVEGAMINEEHVEEIVDRLNAAPLDWPLRYNGRKRRLARGGAK